MSFLRCFEVKICVGGKWPPRPSSYLPLSLLFLSALRLLSAPPIMKSKNTPRFLDYRRSPLPLDVALSFALPVDYGSTPRELILSNKVHVNDVPETSCHRLVCRHDDKLLVHGVQLQMPLPMPRYFICYKPRGVICSNKRNEGVDRLDAVYISDWLNDAFERQTPPIYDHTKIKTINTVGRLDEESEGLLLLTNDGSFSRLLCDPEFGLEKTYRVVAKGCGFSSLQSSCLNQDELIKRIIEMIENGNPIEVFVTPSNAQIRYETCEVLDVGRLPSQHSSDDSYYVLLDLTLREGKTHAVRRIIKNSGLRVFYLSRIKVEGLDEFAVVKPSTLADAAISGYVLAPNRKIDAKDGNHVTGYCSQSKVVLNPGEIVQLKSCHVDKIFSLRTS